MSEVIWRPSPTRIRRARITSFARAVNRQPDYADLWRWSVAEPARFWRAVWDQCRVAGTRSELVLADGDRMPGARWFPDAQLSYVENLLGRRGDRTAIVFRSEDGRRAELSYAELADRVARLSVALAELGVQSGDRVAALLPNVPEAVIAMLATAELGATWSSCSPDFGTPGVIDRFAQIEPQVLFFPDGYSYKGKHHAQLPRLDELRHALPGLRHVVLVGCTGEATPHHSDALRLDDLLDRPAEHRGHARRAFDHPLFALFSSGTTGRPKCILHGQGGTLLQHLKEHRLHTDLGQGDRLFYFTTTGWMMWNWLVSALASDTTIVLWDGSPFWPDPNALWRMAAEEEVTVFGTSARYLDACRKQGLVPLRDHDLSALRTVLSTGSPLTPECFDWVSESVGDDVLLSSISGGTDIVSCFTLGCPILPVYRGELQCRGLGMNVEVFDEAGRSVVGTPGELVCTAPFPSMPIGFWADGDGSRFRKAYFERDPGVWHHGDWATLTERETVVITGRSDATLNPGGVRIGTAEIYRQVETLDEVMDSVAVGIDPGDGDVRVVLLVVLRDQLALDDALVERIRSRIRGNLTPRHVPATVVQVRDVPRTRNGKVSELAARDALAGRPIGNTGALANPECLAELGSIRLEL
jgi:acetoacetyl-CoA synthetase